MYLNSKTINAFILRIKNLMSQIMVKEMDLDVYNSWVTWNDKQYYFQIHIIESKSILASFDSEFFSFDFSQKLLSVMDNEYLKNIIRHELVHMVCFLQYGPGIQAHGHLFKKTAASFDFDEEVLKASSDFDNQSSVNHHENDKIVEKIKKLMALASSSNANEAQAATLKANELLEKYNIDKYKEELLGTNSDQYNQDVIAYSKNILRYPRKCAKLSAIGGIVNTFWVSSVFCGAQGGVNLCVVGEKHNVLMAEYVALFLDSELERLWNITKIQNPHLKGIRAKNSFFYGVRKGYVEKIERAQYKSKKSESNIEMALAIVEKKIKEYEKIAFSRLTQARSSSRIIDSNSTEIGKTVGRNLSINKGLDSSNFEVFMLN